MKTLFVLFILFPMIVYADTIKITRGKFDEDLIYDNGITMTLSGGWDCDYISNEEHYSTINSLTIISGSVIIDNIIIK